MTRDDIHGFILISLIPIGGIYREELADFVGVLLNNLFTFFG